MLKEKYACSIGIAMETTGTYSKDLYEQLIKAHPELYISICNPVHIHYYMKSITMNKTDKQDAEVIAKYAEHVRPDCYKKATQDQQKHKALTRERTMFVEQRTTLRNYKKSISESGSLKRIQATIDVIDEQIKHIDQEIKTYIDEQASEACREEIKLMDTMPGIALLSAAVIYGELGSLTGYTRKQLSSISGICPIQIQSGTSLHKGGLSKRGPVLVRKILFLDVEQAIRKVPFIKAFHEKMLAKANSSIMSVRVACMRKLLLVLRGMVVSNKPFDPEHVSEDPRKPVKTDETA